MKYIHVCLVIPLFSSLCCTVVAMADTGLDGTAMTSSSFTLTGTVSISTLTATYISATTLSNQIMSYRRPVLKYNSSTVVNVETGNLGISGQATIIFPDGAIYTESTTANIQCDLTKKASWGTGTAQAGLRPSETLNNNQWEAIYVVKSSASGNTSDFVTVASTYLPVQANYSSLNTFFGVNAWQYLGLIRYGDGGATGNVILKFTQTGNLTYLQNMITGANSIHRGMLLATSALATSITWTYSVGVSGASVPDNINLAYINFGTASNAVNPRAILQDSSANNFQIVNLNSSGANSTNQILVEILDGLKLAITSGSGPMDIALGGWFDMTLGVGSNPLL